MEGNIHIKSLEATANEEVNNKAFVSRDHKVGETLGVLIYDITKTAKSDRAYEDQVSLLSLLGMDVGELNYSCMFPGKLLPYLTNNINAKIK